MTLVLGFSVIIIFNFVLKLAFLSFSRSTGEIWLYVTPIWHTRFQPWSIWWVFTLDICNSYQFNFRLVVFCKRENAKIKMNLKPIEISWIFLKLMKLEHLFFNNIACFEYFAMWYMEMRFECQWDQYLLKTFDYKI